MADLGRMDETLKRRILALDCVSGVSQNAKEIKVYIIGSEAEARSLIEPIIQEYAPGVPVRFIESGPFLKH